MKQTSSVAPQADGNAEIPSVARGIIDHAMSPFCPGLTLAACPSPSADSLRRDITARVRAGESKASIENSLRTDFGTAISGAPEFSGTGLIAWLAPGLLVVVGGLLLTVWLRRRMRLAPRRHVIPAAGRKSAAGQGGSLENFSDTEVSRLASLLKHDV